jgi:hypothetical protein
MIGATGNNEYLGPAWLTILWTMLAGAIVGVGALFARRRQALSIGAILAFLLALPVAAQAYYLPKLYLTWMGRYDLPTFVGLVIFSAGALSNRLEQKEIGRMLIATVGAVASLQILEFAGTLRRYVVGVNGPLDPLDWGSGWHPLIGAVPLLALGVVVIAYAYISIYAMARRTVTP